MDFHTFQPTVTIDKSCNYYGESSTALAMVAKKEFISELIHVLF